MRIRNGVIGLVVLLLLSGGISFVSAYASADIGIEQLENVRALLANIASVSYARHEVIEKASSGYEFLPEIVKKIIYYSKEENVIPFRVDYFKKRFLLPDKFLVRQYSFVINGEIRYEVWTRDDNSLIRFTYISPVAKLKRDDNTENRKTEYFDYDKSGNLMKRRLSSVHIDHNKKRATFTYKKFDSQGNLIKENSGDAVYEEFL